MRILSYIIMPNHWHLILHPKNNGDLSKFMGWITNTHTRRWHTAKKTIGQGHLYQGRYKSFICQDDVHFLTLVRYVERNAKKANIVERAENWKWGSAYRLRHGTEKQEKLLSVWPVEKPINYYGWLNEQQTEIEEKIIEKSIAKSFPFGRDGWVKLIVEKFNLESTLRSPGRPKKGG